jgi:hypothetical protein
LNCREKWLNHGTESRSIRDVLEYEETEYAEVVAVQGLGTIDMYYYPRI